jgi:hypothetical protein
MRQVFEEKLIEHCAPTLAGMKPASLFRFCGETPKGVLREVRTWDARLRGCGIRVIVLKQCPRTKAYMIYVYRPACVQTILSQKAVAEFLKSRGYTLGELPFMLKQLSRRYCMECDMPHEIGVFLGYPLADVVGFIEHKGRDFTVSGYWKSYSNAQEAQNCFANYRRCTEDYKALHQQGVPTMRLVVAA